jgi:hypothetical protein
MLLHRSTASLLVLSALVFPACGDAPRSAPPEGPDASAPSDPHAGLPSGHPSLDAAQPPASSGQVAGRAILKGDLAQASSGCLFVTLRIADQKMPTWTYRVDVVDPSKSGQGLAASKDGVRELIFVLNQQTSLFPGAIDPTGRYEVQVMYDPDANVDSKEGQVSAIAKAKIGADDVYLELDPAAAK